MEFNEALQRINQIHGQLHAAQKIQNFRVVAVFVTAFFALAGGVLQYYFIPNPVANPIEFLILWTVTALLGVAFTAIDMQNRYRYDSASARKLTNEMVAQFVPFLLGGAGLTAVVLAVDFEHFYILPTLWSFAFGFAIFSVRRFLNAKLSYAAAYFIVSGILLPILLGKEALLYGMPVLFGVGQILTAVALQKGNHGSSQI